STVEATLTASESLRTAATRSSDRVGSALLDLVATTTPDPPASIETTSCTYAASRALASCGVEPLTGPPRKMTLEDARTWSGVTLMRSPACRASNAAVDGEGRAGVEWSAPARIALTSTVAATWSGLLAPVGTLSEAANPLS